MPNTIIYQASTDDAINGCAYSLLKYLAVYNMKPPADHVLQVHTHRPALLEMYGSFFSSFVLKKPFHEPVNPSVLKRMEYEKDSNVLFLASNVYPVADLNPMFSRMEKGEIFISKRHEHANGVHNSENYRIIGLNTNMEFVPAQAGSPDPSAFIAQFRNMKEFNAFLRYFFKRYQEESVPNQVKLLQHIDAQKIEEEKNAFSNLPFHTRILKKLSGKAWNIKHYTGKI